MRRVIEGFLLASLFVLLQASPARATIDHIVGGDVCVFGCAKDVEYPVRQGQTTTVTVQGQYVDLSTGVEVTGSGVTVSGTATSSSSKSIRIVVDSNAEPGLRTVKLHYLVEVNGPDTFKIRVVRNGRVTNIDVPSPTQFFSDVNITMTGENIGNAVLLGNTMVRVGDNAYSATTFSTPPELVENTSTRVVIHLHFNDGPLAEGFASLTLYDKSCGSICQNESKFRYNDTSFISITGPNALKSIDVPNAAAGNLLNIKVTLLRPVVRNFKSPTPVRANTSGEPIFWQLLPANSFEAAPGSGTQYSATGQNQVYITPGSDSVLLTVRVKPGSGGTGSVMVQFGSPSAYDVPLTSQQKNFSIYPSN